MWKKIVAPIGLVTLLWIGSSAATTYYLEWVEESHLRSLTENVTTIQAAAAMESRMWRLHAVQIADSDQDAPGKQGEGATERQRRDIEDLVDGFERAFADANNTALTAMEKLSITNIRRRFDRYRRHIDKDSQPPPRDAKTAAAANREAFSLASAVAEGCRELSRVNEHLIDQMALARASWTKNIRALRMLFMVAGPLVGILVGFWTARGLQRSVSQISFTLSDAAGRLSVPEQRLQLEPSTDLSTVHGQVRAIAVKICAVVDELQNTRRQVLAAERLAAVGELAAGVAHDLRNPLTSVQLLVQMAIRKGPEGALTGRQLEVIERELSRMEKTVQALLDFARPPKLHRVHHDLRDTVRRAITLLDGRARQQHVDIRSELGNLPLVVDGDSEQLHQLFVNLLLNAIDVSPRGGRVGVTAERTADAPDWCRVDVADDGPGIPSNLRERIFLPFVTTKERGTGLGLTICLRTVEEHHGRLTADNRAAGGTCFHVELPLSSSD